MDYDPIKHILSKHFNRWPVTRKMFYGLLNFFLLRTWHIRRALKKHAWEVNSQKTVDVLDAGSGFGQYTYFMAKRFPTWNIVAVDLKKEEIVSCTRFFKFLGIDRALFQEADLTKFTRNQAFDLILSVDVMEHIEEDESVFHNFFISLKDGGLLIINTPSDLGGSGVKEPEQHGFIGEHVRNGYSKSEIEHKLRQAGFSLIDARYTYGKPGNVSWHLSMKFPMVCLGLSKWFFLVLPFYFLMVLPVVYLLNVADVAMNHPAGTGLLVKAYKKKKEAPAS